LYTSPAKIILMYMKRYVVPLNAFFQLVGTCCLPGYLLEAAYQPVHLHYSSFFSFLLVRLLENMFSPKTQVFVKYNKYSG
jgi:hypothetical protein